mmetsp:Transcript_13178/g.26179  ORF Transcript_13178/g.26179 Transcript_13178/m.26179 type:complete len:310 (-) Transcript_13178:41-970(-)
MLVRMPNFHRHGHIIFSLLLLALYFSTSSGYIIYAAKGFSSKGSTSKPAGSLGKAATKFLKQHKGDVDAASGAYFESKLQDMDEELREKIGSSGGSSEVIDEGPVRDAFVELKWNTVAAFMSSSKVDKELVPRLGVTAKAVSGSRVLDVGSGDGSFVPFLEEYVPTLHYTGLDVASEMVKKASALHPKFSFSHGSFMTSPLADSSQHSYDTIVFNASLQFFFQPREALRRALETLGPGGRIIITHPRGGDFVRLESRSNPRLAVPLPTLDMLDHWIESGDLPSAKLLSPQYLGSEERLENFYLVAIERL